MTQAEVRVLSACKQVRETLMDAASIRHPGWTGVCCPPAALGERQAGKVSESEV